MPKEEIPKTFISNKEKAFEMAKVEDIYRTLAINAEKAGLETLAEDYKKLSGEKAEETGRKWEEKQEEKEINKNVILPLVKKLEEIRKAEVEGKVGKIGYPGYIEYVERVDPKSKIEQILGVEKLPYRINERPSIPDGEIREEYYETALRRVIFRKSFSLPSCSLISKLIDLHSKESWQKELEAMKEKNKG